MAANCRERPPYAPTGVDICTNVTATLTVAMATSRCRIPNASPADDGMRPLS